MPRISGLIGAKYALIIEVIRGVVSNAGKTAALDATKNWEGDAPRPLAAAGERRKPGRKSGVTRYPAPTAPRPSAGAWSSSRGASPLPGVLRPTAPV